MAIWMDMTNSLHTWQGGIVGIVRAELEIAKNLHKENPNIRFSFFDGNRFLEVDTQKLKWLWESENIGDAYIEVMGRKHALQVNEEKKDDIKLIEKSLQEEYPKLAEAYGFSPSRLARLSHGVKLYFQTLPKWIGKPMTVIGKAAVFPLKKISLAKAHSKERKQILKSTKISKENNAAKAEPVPFSYPYEEGDILFSCGWFTSEKEWAFSRIKYELHSFTLIYLIYDIILMLPETKHFYSESLCDEFKKYFEWISFHCDYIFYGGETAKNDSQEYQKSHNFPVAKGFSVRFGADIIKMQDGADTENIISVRKQYNISSEYLIMVGSVEKRKNYNTIYRAYTILIDRYGKGDIPDLVIVGKTDDCVDLQNCIKTDPRTKDKIKFISPSNSELDCLYKNCVFAMLASAYEGWSLTLPEALGYHKFCLVSDVPPLREVGGDLVEYVDTFDSLAWAEQIYKFSKNKKLLNEKENNISKKWNAITWADCGKQISGYLNEIEKKEKENILQPTVYIDISTTWWFANSNQKISGITRTEIMLTYYLFRKLKNVKCFSWLDGIGFQPVYTSQLMYMLCAENPTDGFDQSRWAICYINNFDTIHEEQRKSTSEKASAFWYICSILSAEKQKNSLSMERKRN